jgi:hypothetical protein
MNKLVKELFQQELSRCFDDGSVMIYGYWVGARAILECKNESELFGYKKLIQVFQIFNFKDPVRDWKRKPVANVPRKYFFAQVDVHDYRFVIAEKLQTCIECCFDICNIVSDYII